MPTAEVGTMPSTGRLMEAMRLGDSGFPGGGFAFSGGLEGLAADGGLSGPDALAAVVQNLALGRWLPGDRVALVQAYRAGGDLDRLVELDDALDALSLSRELRTGGRQNGMGLLTAHGRLGTPGIERYRQAVLDRRSPGQLAIVQGVVWHACGLDERAAEATGAHQFLAGLLGAAVRLGVVGVIAAQRIRLQVGPQLADALGAPVPAEAEPAAFCPAAEIAAMRHETQATRLFAN